MKRMILVLIIMFSFILVPHTLHSQIMVKNPATPLGKDHGRIVQLKEVMRIKDDGAGTSFRAPYDILMGENGGVLFYDNFVLYKFDKDGHRQAAMVRNGQGPGEANMRTGAVVINGRIQVLALAPPKVMIFDAAGQIQNEVKTEVFSNYGVLGLGESMWIFRTPRFNSESVPANGGEIDLPISLEEMAPDFSHTIKAGEFPRRYYFINRGMWYEWSGFGWAAKEPDRLYIHHTSAYRIAEFNTTSHKVERIISREYSRVERPTESREASPGVKLPPRKYYDDILALLVYGDRLWAVTSTVDTEKNRLVDVFDLNGRYIDCFYLRFPGSFTRRIYQGRIATDGIYLYTIDEAADGFMSIGKYSMEK